MACFDYEEVECAICHEKLQDGYRKIKGKIICDECNKCPDCGSQLKEKLIWHDGKSYDGIVCPNSCELD